MKWLLIVYATHFCMNGTDICIDSVNYIKSFTTKEECEKIGNQIAPSSPFHSYKCTEERD